MIDNDTDLPITRHRRMRRHPWQRALLQEHHLGVYDLIEPVILREENAAADIETMPDIKRLTIAELVDHAGHSAEAGINLLALFPFIDPDKKDEDGSEALNDNNLMCRAMRAVKQAGIEIGLMGDVALDPYTTHGHDGVLDDEGFVANDDTVSVLCDQALLLADAGCDVIAPSDMMDGRIGAIRAALDDNGFIHSAIFSYAAKYASAFYGPFRDAVGSKQALSSRDKKSYQMNPANGEEALREALTDLEEGADVLIVKPGTPYLDVIYRLKQSLACPIAAYHVSGEYAILKAGGQSGLFNEQRAVMEIMHGFKRAGTDMIITYYARQIAHWIKQGWGA